MSDKDIRLHSEPTESLQAHQEALLALLTEFDRVCKALNIPYVLFAGTLLGAVRHQGFIPWDDDVDVLLMREDYERLLREADTVLDQEKFYLQKEFSEHWPMFFSKLRLNGTTCLEKFHPKDPQIHQGVYMDIFPCDNASESRIGRLIQFAGSKIVIAKGLDAEGYETGSKLKIAAMRISRCLPRGIFHSIVKGPKKTGTYVHSFFAAASSFEKNVYPAEYFSDPVELPFEGEMYPVPRAYDALLTTLYGDYMTLPPEAERVCKQHAILVDLERSYEAYAHYRDGMKFDVPTRSIR